LDKLSEPALNRSSDGQSTDQRLTSSAGVVLGYGGDATSCFSVVEGWFAAATRRSGLMSPPEPSHSR